MIDEDILKEIHSQTDMELLRQLLYSVPHLNDKKLALTVAIEYTYHKNWMIRRNAIFVLGEMGNIEATHRLIEIIEEECKNAKYIQYGDKGTDYCKSVDCIIIKDCIAAIRQCGITEDVYTLSKYTDRLNNYGVLDDNLIIEIEYLVNEADYKRSCNNASKFTREIENSFIINDTSNKTSIIPKEAYTEYIGEIQLSETRVEPPSIIQNPKEEVISGCVAGYSPHRQRSSTTIVSILFIAIVAIVIMGIVALSVLFIASIVQQNMVDSNINHIVTPMPIPSNTYYPLISYGDVTGRVHNKNGAVAHATIVYRGESVTTDNNGYYSIMHIPYGIYEIFIWDSSGSSIICRDNMSVYCPTNVINFETQ